MSSSDSGPTGPRVLFVYFTYTQQSLKVAEAMADTLRGRGCVRASGWDRVDGFALVGAVYAQRPSVSPQPRPSFLPTGGHVFSPLVAIESPHHQGCGVGSGQGLDPLAGGCLGEPVAVLAFGDRHVGVVE